MPRFTMFSTGGRYTERELAELNRRYEACMAKVNPRDRDALKEWLAGSIEVDPNFCERELMPASAPWRGSPCAAFSVGKSYILSTARNPGPPLDRWIAQRDGREKAVTNSRGGTQQARWPAAFRTTWGEP
jgi:hypothetical protein